MLRATLVFLAMSCTGGGSSSGDTTAASDDTGGSSSSDTASSHDTASSDDTSSSETSAGIDITGTWRGTLVASLQPYKHLWMQLDLTQTDTQVTGEMTTENGRFATMSGDVADRQLQAEFTYTDSCQGTGTAQGALSADAQTIDGSFSANDCYGPYTGDFTVDLVQ